MKKYGRFFGIAVMVYGESPSDFAALVTSPHSEEAFSRALPAQKAPHEVGSWPSLRGLRGLPPFAAIFFSPSIANRPELCYNKNIVVF